MFFTNSFLITPLFVRIKNPPWFDNEIRQLLNKKNEMLKHIAMGN